MSEIPTILLLPGLDGTGRLFDRLVPELESWARVRRISYPSERFLGYGELAGVVLGQAPEEPFAIVAESFSGPVAIMAAARKPPALRGIILSASFVVPPAPSWLRIVPFELFFRVGVPKAALRHFLLDSRSAAQMVPEVMAALEGVAPSVLGARVREVLTSITSQEFRSCAVPVVFLCAGADRLLGLRALRRARRVLPSLEAVTIGGPHMLLQARPKEAAAVIHRYVRRWLAS